MKGAGATPKKGGKAKNIRLTDNPEEIEAQVAFADSSSVLNS